MTVRGAALSVPAHSLGSHVNRTLRLALPVMASRAGLLVLTVADSIMTGRASATELAYYGIAMAPHIFTVLVGIGLLMGTVVLAAQADGAGKPEECGQVWRIALLHALAYGIVLLALSYAGGWFLHALGQPADLANQGGAVITVFGWGIPGLLLFVATTSFLEAIGRPVPSMVIMAIANVLNIGLNWIFIYGHWGAGATGAEGAALATSLVRWFMFFALAAYVLWRVDRRYYGIDRPLANVRALGGKLRRIGYPMALAQGLESSSFSAMTIFAGYLGPAHVAAYQINMTLIALVFMSALGFATAASVRVGNAVGRRDPQGVRWAGWTAGALVVGVLAGWAAVFALAPRELVLFYTGDPEVLNYAVAALIVGAFVLVPDGFQAVMMGGLRGVADVWAASLLALIAFWLVMVPVAYLLGVHWGRGAPGLMQGVLVGVIVAAALLATRFHVVSKRVIARL